jgi:hypothetical protein
MFKKRMSEAAVSGGLSAICHVRHVPDRRQTPSMEVHSCLIDLRGDGREENSGDFRGERASAGRCVGTRHTD